MLGSNNNANKPFSFSLTSTPASNTTAPGTLCPTQPAFSFVSSSNTASSQPGSTGSLSSSFNFGNSGGTSTGGGLFGSTVAAKPPGASLFGSNTTTSGSTTNPTANTCSSFGTSIGCANSLAPTTTTTSAHSLSGSTSTFNFGASANTTVPTAASCTTQPATGSCLFIQSNLSGAGKTTLGFGSSSTTTANKPFSFSSSNTNTLAPSNGLFGQSAISTASTIATASLTVPAFSVSTPSNNKTTPFSFTATTPLGSRGLSTSITNQPSEELSKSLFASSTSTGLTSSTTTAAPTTFSSGATNSNLFGASLNTCSTQSGTNSSTVAAANPTTTIGFGAMNLATTGATQPQTQLTLGTNLSQSSTKTTISGSASVGTNLADASKTGIPSSSSLSFLSSSKPTSSVTLPSISVSNNTTASQPAETSTTTGPGLGSSTFSSLITKPADLTSTTTSTQPNISNKADVKPTIGLGLGTLKVEATASDKTTKSTILVQESSLTTAGTLPSVLSFSVPSLTPTKSTQLAPGDLNKTLSSATLGNVSTATSTAISSSTSAPTVVIRSQLPKDQPIPQTLIECVENFKKYLEEMKKVKELNLTYTSRALHHNIQDIITLKQKLKQSKTDMQRNVNETNKLKGQITQELRNAEICNLLKDMPIGLQYETDIWNEYFQNRIQMYENRFRIFKTQFEQLDDYFKMHDQQSFLDPGKIIEALKVTHKNLLNDAANLKAAHESVEKLKNDFKLYRRNLIGDMSEIFNNETDENQPVSTSILRK